MMKVVGTFKVNGIDYVTIMSGNNACAMKKKEYESILWMENNHKINVAVLNSKFIYFKVYKKSIGSEY